MLQHHLDHQILDPLHYSELGIPKTPWKHGVLNNASDDARDAISAQLKAWKHPLDCRRKDDNRCRAQKWFTGEAWGSFCAGHGGSPGGPVAIATIALIIADDMQQRGVSKGSGEVELSTHATHESLQQRTKKVATTAPKAKPQQAQNAAGGRKAKFQAAQQLQNSATAEHEGEEEGDSQTTVAPEPAKLLHQPSAMELAADQEDIAMIR